MKTTRRVAKAYARTIYLDGADQQTSVHTAKGEPMTNKEWLATLSAEDFYKEFKRAEEVGKSWTSTSGYVIQWLDEERRSDE